MAAETEAWRRAHTYSLALAEITGRRTAVVKGANGEWTTCWAWRPGSEFIR